MMSYLPPEPKDPKKPTTTRVVLWIAVAGIGVYSIIQGIIGIVQHG
jgi:hypothetical protein